MKRCNQCWRRKPASDFDGGTQDCKSCRAKYRGWAKLSKPERAMRVIEFGSRTEPESTYRVLFVLRSQNRKLGGIPSTMTDRGTCPPACSFYEAGCYANHGMTGMHWRATATKGLTWKEFLSEVERLPTDQLWRHATAGDLPGSGRDLDEHALLALLSASRHTRGFTFTHKVLETVGERSAVALANGLGSFTINLSADDLDHADERADLGIGPVAVVVPHDAPDKMRTPKGRHVIVCPAQTSAKRTCANCGLCAQADRKAIVAFRAHGQSKGLITEIVRARRETA